MPDPYIRVRVTTVWTDTISTGDPAGQNVRVTTVSTDTISTGAPSGQNVRVTAAWIDVVAPLRAPQTPILTTRSLHPPLRMGPFWFKPPPPPVIVYQTYDQPISVALSPTTNLSYTTKVLNFLVQLAPTINLRAIKNPGPTIRLGQLVQFGQRSYAKTISVLSGTVDSRTSLLLHADGINNGTIFTDSSLAPHPVVVGGTVHTDTSQQQFGSASARFTTPGDKLSLDGSAAFAFGTGDFTIDFWMRLAATGSQVNVFDCQGTGANLIIYYSGSVMAYFVGNGTRISGTTVLQANQWYHIAVTRTGTTTTLFVNGISQGIYIDPNNYVVPANAPSIGSQYGSSNFTLNGWLDEIHVVKGQALWTSNFQPPISAYTIPLQTTVNLGKGKNISLISLGEAIIAPFALVPNLITVLQSTAIAIGRGYTKTIPILPPGLGTNLLLHLDGAVGSTTTIDSSPSKHTVNINGTAVIDNAQVKFGSGSLLTHGTAGERIALDGSAEFAFGTGDFTIDFWLRITSNLGLNTIIYDSRPVGSNGSYPTIYIDTANHLNFFTNSLNRTVGTTTFPLNQWNHIAVTRAAGNTRTFLNGVQEGSTFVDATSYINGASRPSIAGYGVDDSTAASPKGWTDEVRVIKGQALWTANFTPPNAPVSAASLATILNLVRPKSIASLLGQIIVAPSAFIPQLIAVLQSSIVTIGKSFTRTIPVGPNANLLLHCEGASGSATFTDSSPSRHVVTVNGATTLSATQAKFGTSSAGFTNVAGQRLALDGSNDFAFGTGDFTVDFWLWFTTLNAGTNIDLYDTRPLGNTSGVSNAVIYLQGSTSTIVYFTGSGGNVITGTTVPQLGRWHHVALTRQGTSTRLFLNGVQEGATFSDSTNYIVGASRPAIGGLATDNTNAQSVNGFMDEIRVVKGRALWTANFTPPGAPYDSLALQVNVNRPLTLSLIAIGETIIAPFAFIPQLIAVAQSAIVRMGRTFAKTITPYPYVSLLHFDGQNASTTINDSAPGHTWTCVGTAAIDTSQFQFGVASAKFDGSSTTSIDGDGSPAFAFGTNDWTVEGWIRLAATGTQYNFWDSRGTGDSTGTGRFVLYINSGNLLAFWTQGANRITGSTALVANQWYHWACTRTANTIRIFLNGVQQGTFVDATSYGIPANRPRIGRTGDISGFALNGWLDEIRIINGKSLYSANFTPPTNRFDSLSPTVTTNPRKGFAISVALAQVVHAPYAFYNLAFQILQPSVIAIGRAIAKAIKVGPNANLLLHFEAPNGSTTFIDSSPSGHIVTRHLGTGSETPVIDTSQSVFGTSSVRFHDGTGEYLSLDGSDEFAFGTGDFTIDMWFKINNYNGMPWLYDARPGIAGPYSQIFLNDPHMGYDVNGGLQILSGPTNIIVGNWYHVAVTRASGVTRLFLSGILQGSFNDATNYLIGPNRPRFGWSGTASDTDGTSAGFNGWLDEVRVVKGKALWTANFTPPARRFDSLSPILNVQRPKNFAILLGEVVKQGRQFTQSLATSLAISASILFGKVFKISTTLGPQLVTLLLGRGKGWRIPLPQALILNKGKPKRIAVRNAPYQLALHFDGESGTSNFVDSSAAAHTVTTNGALLDSAQAKFGPTSARFHGITSEAIFIDGSNDFTFDGDFTIDFWFRIFSNISGSIFLYDSRSSTDTGPNILIYIRNTTGHLIFHYAQQDFITGTTIINSGTTPGWHHIACTRANGNVRLFFDGVQEGPTFVDSTTYLNDTNRPAIGGPGFGGGTSFLGWIDELRVVKGQALWTSNFDPPTAPADPLTTIIRRSGPKNLAALLASIVHPGIAYKASPALQLGQQVNLGIGKAYVVNVALNSLTNIVPVHLFQYKQSLAVTLPIVATLGEVHHIPVLKSISVTFSPLVMLATSKGTGVSKFISTIISSFVSLVESFLPYVPPQPPTVVPVGYGIAAGFEAMDTFVTAVVENALGYSTRVTIRGARIRQFMGTLGPLQAAEMRRLRTVSRSKWPLSIRDWSDFEFTDEVQTPDFSLYTDPFNLSDDYFPLRKRITPQSGSSRYYHQRILVPDQTIVPLVVKRNGIILTPDQWHLDSFGVLVINNGVLNKVFFPIEGVTDVVTVSGQYLVPVCFVGDDLSSKVLAIGTDGPILTTTVQLREILEPELNYLMSQMDDSQ